MENRGNASICFKHKNGVWIRNKRLFLKTKAKINRVKVKIFENYTQNPHKKGRSDKLKRQKQRLLKRKEKELSSEANKKRLCIFSFVKEKKLSV